jgi:hypothetical protein
MGKNPPFYFSSPWGELKSEIWPLWNISAGILSASVLKFNVKFS